MIEMPIVLDDEPMGDNHEYGYFPDCKDHEQLVFNEGGINGFA
jgi:hypothetical protein